MFLLDTEVALELRKAKAGRTDAGLSAWAASVPRQNLFLSALSLLEIETATARLERRDKVGGQAMRTWISDQLLPAFDGRVLPIDVAVVRRRAQLPYADPRDALLAATAVEHSLTLATRNVAAFKAGRVKLFNPWGYRPDAAEDEGDWGQLAKSGPLWLKNLFVRS
ncbi:type II toxin-antitoxin system VapC family toxin [Phenylobacterium deserti]|uniref:VapC toxin family PIN domain ribonuclease n=1 Tax=Phenylobacterium deserti TaxID=1914756 RepID=A0A328ADQ9_9CAUL|nr:type II toxin-antitoxin system VapC family toxin [Phenylobacterium deserti]RAK51544.1 VapC toxin family PIN domain ribonuclease [Phenylobacterium deserti]